MCVNSGTSTNVHCMSMLREFFGIVLSLIFTSLADMLEARTTMYLIFCHVFALMVPYHPCLNTTCVGVDLGDLDKEVSGVIGAA